jgi:hypothetical protein
MHRRLTFFLTGVLFFAASVLIIPQDEPKDVLYMVHKDDIKANMVQQYEKAVNDLYEQLKTHNFGMQIQFASSTDQNEYFYLTPMESYADLGKAEAIWSELYEKAGEETMAAIDEQFKGCYEQHRNYVIKWSGELSYRAANPRLKAEDVNFIHWDFFWIEEGNEMKAMEISKKFKELYAKNNITDSYNMWMSDIGHDLGMMVMTRGAKDIADYYEQREKTRELMKDELIVLINEFNPLLKDFDHKNGKPHPEWVYTPSE